MENLDSQELSPMNHTRFTVAATEFVLTCLILSGLGVSTSFAQQKSQETGFLQRTHTDDGGEHQYQLFVPTGYSADTQWPIIVFLHGAGERGIDGDAPTQVGLGPFLRTRQTPFPFLVLFTQCEDPDTRLLDGWRADGADAKRMLKILEEVEEEYSVDPKHRILTGWSMGGYGAWSIGAATPELWSAVVPVSSGGDSALAEQWPNVPVWTIHGQRDNVVRPSAVTGLIDELRNQGRRPWLSIIATAGHDVWQIAYGSEALLNWMLAPTNDGSPPELVATAESINAATADHDFEPVLEIPNAVALRLGNRMLNAVSYAIPGRVPEDAVSGDIPDIHDSTSAEGIRFAVTFSRIRYRGKVSRAKVKAVGENRLRLQLGLTDVSLAIGSTYIRGRGRSATAGPTTIAIGTRRPVWLNIDVEPNVQDRQLKLRALSSSFTIERDNWHVTRPRGISTRGLGMTQRRVSDALVQGLRSRKSRIEREVVAAVPSILERVEDMLDLSDAGQATDAVWPLPVYPPVAKAWPQAVSTDSNGVSITMGLSVAAPTDQNLAFRVAESNDDVLLAAGSEQTLQVGISPRMLGPLTQLLVESDVAQINVLDIPGDAFVGLTHRDRLMDVIPKIAEYPENAEIRTELVLTKSMSLQRESSPANVTPPVSGEPAVNALTQSGVLQLNAPGAVLRIAARESDGSWTPAAEFELSVSQRITIQVNRMEESSGVRLLPAADVQVIVPQGRTLIGGPTAADDAARTIVATMFSDAWNAWIAGESFTETQVAALDFQQTRLQLQDILLADETIITSFDIPPVRIENLSEEVLMYELKGPASGWGGPYGLEPGKSHRYDLDYSLSYRWTSNGTTTVYTLKPGSESEFRLPSGGGPAALFRKQLD
jgi:predicted esterase